MSIMNLRKQTHFPGREVSRIAPNPAPVTPKTCLRHGGGRDCAPLRCRARSSVVLKAVGGVA